MKSGECKNAGNNIPQTPTSISPCWSWVSKLGFIAGVKFQNPVSDKMSNDTYNFAVKLNYDLANQTTWWEYSIQGYSQNTPEHMYALEGVVL